MSLFFIRRIDPFFFPKGPDEFDNGPDIGAQVRVLSRADKEVDLIGNAQERIKDTVTLLHKIMVQIDIRTDKASIHGADKPHPPFDAAGV